MAAAKGCSLFRSRLAANSSSFSSSIDMASPSDPTITEASLGRPSVNVPVLSTTSVSICRKRSSTSALRISTPSLAPRPTPTMIDIGVASPSAQGQAMISTATALMTAKAAAGGGPQTAQTTKVIAAAVITTGTNQPATRSATRWIGARLRCASATSRVIRDSRVSSPTCSAIMTKPPAPLIVPPVTVDPGTFATGIGSPLIIDSSTELLPSTTSPSTGTCSPGRTRMRAPTCTQHRCTSRSSPEGSITRAVCGASSSSAWIAPCVRPRARPSSTWPSSTRVTITAAASK